MIDFMVLSAPRSASTWAANWLTTHRTLCLHDPLLEHTVEELDGIPHAQATFGISCTALPLCHAWVDAHAARKLVLHRDIADIDASLKRIGLTALSRHWTGALERLRGMHVHYLDLFQASSAKRIWEYLTETDFDPGRHRHLTRMRVTPYHPKVPIDAECARDFRRRIERAFA
jgi:hypothetical protein